MNTDSSALLASLPSSIHVPGAASPWRRLGSDELPALTALYRRRAQWMEARGIDQWAASDADRISEVFAECLRSGVVFGKLGPGAPGDGIRGDGIRGDGIRGESGLQAAALLRTRGPLWTDSPRARDEPVLYLEKLMTDPRASAGLGSACLRRLEALLAEAGCALLRMDCLAASRPLRRFWQTRHYMPRGEALHPSGHRVLLHEKRLRPPPAAEVPIAFGDDVLDRPFAGVRATLLFVVRDERVLLIHKKRGLGAGKINGPGGKCEPGETPRACAVRETAEELRIDVAEPEYRGELRYLDTAIEPIHGFVYVARDFTSTPTETDEARPEWFALHAVPWDRMWADDRMWLPWVLEGENMRAAFLGHEDRIEDARLVLGPTPEPET